MLVGRCSIVDLVSLQGFPGVLNTLFPLHKFTAVHYFFSVMDLWNLGNREIFLGCFLSTFGICFQGLDMSFYHFIHFHSTVVEHFWSQKSLFFAIPVISFGTRDKSIKFLKLRPNPPRMGPYLGPGGILVEK